MALLAIAILIVKVVVAMKQYAQTLQTMELSAVAMEIALIVTVKMVIVLI
jgi:hypothetical protein